jgi:hypothetical protein
MPAKATNATSGAAKVAEEAVRANNSATKRGIPRKLAHKNHTHEEKKQHNMPCIYQRQCLTISFFVLEGFQNILVILSSLCLSTFFTLSSSSCFGLLISMSYASATPRYPSHD